MAIVAWLLFGAAMAIVITALSHGHYARDLRGNVVSGVIGAMVGGYLYNVAHDASTMSLSALGILTAVGIAAIVVRLKQMFTFTED